MDFDLRDHMTFGRHEIVWGVGYRGNWDRLTGGPPVRFTPPALRTSIANGFVQDEITLADGKLWLTLGGKMERNDFTGTESEPTAGLVWAPNGRHSFWASIARSSKIPGRNDRDIAYSVASFTTPEGLPAVVMVFGNANFQSEKLTACEFGYRVQPFKRLSLDLTAFHNDYSHLRTLESGAPRFSTSAGMSYLLFPRNYANRMLGSTYGAESSVEWRATAFWTLKAGHAWFLPNLRLDPGSQDAVVLAEDQGNAPRNQFQVRSLLALPHNCEWDAALYRVGRLGVGSVPAYNRLDVRLGWRPNSRLDLSIVGQNLLSPAHLEFNQTEQSVVSARIERNLYGKVTWRF